MKKIVLLITFVCVLFCAADSQAIVDRVYFSGGWQTYSPPVSTAGYKEIAYDWTSGSGAAYLIYAARADRTGVDRLISTDGAATWTVQIPRLTTTDYKELETVDEIGHQFYAARADGTGLDRVWWNGSGWSTQFMVSGDYKALAVDSGSTTTGLI